MLLVFYAKMNAQVPCTGRKKQQQPAKKMYLFLLSKFKNTTPGPHAASDRGVDPYFGLGGGGKRKENVKILDFGLKLKL